MPLAPSPVDFTSDASALPLADGSVDLVLALDLIEHVPEPAAVLGEIARVLRPGGTVILSVPSTVPRHDDHDYWRFTAQGLEKLGSASFDHGEVHVFGGTFEALGYLAEYYAALTFHVLHLNGRPGPPGVPHGRLLAGPPQRLVLVTDGAAHPGLRPAVRGHGAGRLSRRGAGPGEPRERDGAV